MEKANFIDSLDYDKIYIKKGARYLSESMQQLPVNCIFDKILTGCGGTTIAITNDENYVICVPYVATINNKLESHDNIFAALSGVSVEAIENHILTAHTGKIMVTYDSLDKVVTALENTGKIKEYNILIDEMHLLLPSYVYRNKAVKKVLSLYTKFNKYCFMSATPLKKEYRPVEIEHLPVKYAAWMNIEQRTVKNIRVKNVIGTVAAFINNIQNDNLVLGEDADANYYFFMTSVENINKIVAPTNLDRSNASMLCIKEQPSQ